MPVAWTQVGAWRAERHALTNRLPLSHLVDLVGRLGGLQAQVSSSPVLALQARLSGLSPDTVDTALWPDKTLFKTWAMRGTLHLLPSAEYGVWQSALNTYRNYTKGAWYRYFKVTADELPRMLDAISASLSATPLKRDELADLVAEKSGLPKLAAFLREGFGAYLKPASFQGRLMFGPSDDRNVTFVAPEAWLGPWQTMHPTDALREVARRFLSTNGPATVDDFGRWFALDPKPARTALDSLGADAVQVNVEGEARWILAAELSDLEQATETGTVRLLPAFDPYVIGATRHADRLMDTDERKAIYRPQGWISPVIVQDGRFLGTWRHEVKGKTITIAVSPFAPLSAPVSQAIESEASLLASLFGKELKLEK